MSHKRPEHQGPPDLFYDQAEAKKYTSNSRIVEIQATMSERALELLGVTEEDDPKFIIDLGCGSGLSGEVISDQGHYWVGMDISPAMLDVAVERELDGDMILGDIGQGTSFRPGTFDGAISISALQWLCQADTKQQSVPRRLGRLFASLYAVLSRGSRAVFQFYPENSAQIELVTQQAMRAGFTGGLVVDYPNSAKAKKMFLVLFTGGSQQKMPQALGTETGNQAIFSHARETAKRRNGGKPVKKSREWIMVRKDRAKKQGK